MKANGFFIVTGPTTRPTKEPTAAERASRPARRSASPTRARTRSWAGEAQLDWRPQDGCWSGSVSRGVKAGSYNAPLLGSYLGSGGDASLPYKPEELMAYEVGFKSSLERPHAPERRGVLLRLQDSQAFLFVGVGGVVINADAESYGAELHCETTPIDGLDLSVGIA